MNEPRSEGRARELFRFFGASIVSIGGVMVLYHLALHKWLGDSAESRSAFGDQYGALNVLITGVAFFGLMLSIAIQSRDLRAQTHALELQQKAFQLQISEFKEQKEELRRSAEAQEKVAVAQARANRIAIVQLEFESAKLKLETLIAFAENSPDSSQQRLNFLTKARAEAGRLADMKFPWGESPGTAGD